jgi:ribosomal protein S6--L-glutamate ligase
MLFAVPAHAADFDFYVLSLSWSPSYCAAEGADADPAECAKPRGFVVHGLWPQYERGYPEFCARNAQAPSRKTIDSLSDIMPGASLYGAAVLRQFELQGVFGTVGSEALLRCRDKRTCMQYLCAQGILVPDSIVTNNPQELRSSIRKVGPPPVVIKLLNSTQGLGVVLGESENSAESIMEAFLQTSEKVILQRFIKEVNGSDIRVFIIDNKIVATMERVAAPGEFRSNLHRGAAARQIYLSEEECAVALKAAEVMDLKVAGVDLLRSQQGPMILEVNASPGLEGIEGTSGKDVAAKIIQYIERSVG